MCTSALNYGYIVSPFSCAGCSVRCVGSLQKLFIHLNLVSMCVVRTKGASVITTLTLTIPPEPHHTHFNHTYLNHRHVTIPVTIFLLPPSSISSSLLPLFQSLTLLLVNCHHSQRWRTCKERPKRWPNGTIHVW